MVILVGEDEALSRHALVSLLEAWGHGVIATKDGAEAWAALQSRPDVRLAILDWMMPGLDGLELCRRLRAREGEYVYVILLTARDRTQDIVTGLDAGADEYIVKPFDASELQARLRTGIRIIELLSHVKQLQDLIPLCMYCHNVRTDKKTWQRIEAYLADHAHAMVSHSICEKCMVQHFPEDL